MPLNATCPGCGAPVVFRSAASILAVCEYCQSTLLRQDAAVEDIGKMAALAEDRSPLQLGSEGRYRDVPFTLIGRIQLRYSQGLWNEWYLLFADQHTAWLSEAGGEYVLTSVQPVQEPLPPFEGLRAGQRLQLAGQAWTVTNLETASCVAGEGELPFKVGGGYPVPAVDLKNTRYFATLDYSETPPLLFLGEPVVFDQLAWTRLREGMPLPEKVVPVRSFHCPACGAPMQAKSMDSVAAGCISCGAVIDLNSKTQALLSKALKPEAERYTPQLPLGAKGQLDGAALEVIGFLVRQCRVAGRAYDWREYLLVDATGQYRWLIEYDGHWSLARTLPTLPVELGNVRYEGEIFRHFQTTQEVEVIQVAGEFPWRVQRGERSGVIDYVAPPRMLSCERSDKDLTWSVATYLTPQRIAEMFALKAALPEPVGIHACQPNPWLETRNRTWSTAWKLVLAAILLQTLFLLTFGERLWLRQDFDFMPVQGETTSREFVLPKTEKTLRVRNRTSLNNNWMSLDLVLVNKTSGEAWPVTRELSFYQGWDDGHWTEGSASDEVVFQRIPAGTYYLAIEPEIAPEKPEPVNARLEVLGGGVGWSNWVMLALFVLLWPGFAYARAAAFETRRWLESDHPPADADGGDDD